MSDTIGLTDAPAYAESTPAPDAGPAAAANGAAGKTPRRKGTGLSAMVLPELQALAGQLGISGTTRMRKSELIELIGARQVAGGTGAAPRAARAPRQSAATGTDAGTSVQARGDANGSSDGDSAAVADRPATDRDGSRPAADGALSNGAAGPDTRTDRTVANVPAQGGSRQQPNRAPESALAAGEPSAAAGSGAPSGSEGSRRSRDRDQQRDGQPRRDRDQQRDGQPRENQQQGRAEQQPRENQQQGRAEQQPRENQQQGRAEQQQGRADRGQRPQQQGGQGGQQQGGQQAHRDDDEFGPGGRRRRGRYRDRSRRRGADQFGSEPDTEVTEDDVLVPVAGIVDVFDSYAFVRTSGYLPGPNDVYVSLQQVRKNGLRKGDAVTGAVRAPADGAPPPETGSRQSKFNALVRLDTVNGMTVEEARQRVEFGKLVPLYPQERLRLETEPGVFATRMIDLVAPIGKGQRGLIVSPPKAGKTIILQAIANAISTNNPECHLMVVLVDERPEEVTDMQRTVKGEVIASTFDRQAEDHTTVAELAVERAKRLVELGHDVVILLDSITRLGRAYNQSAPASGRIMSGGVDSSALYPPKRFFGAARNIEHGGSLTILATALVETGSKMDEVIFEEFKGTGNMELRLDRKLADKRIFPAIDVPASSTRREEVLLSREELAIMWQLRRVLAALDAQQAIELLRDRLRSTSSNVEFLMAVQKTTPAGAND